MLRSNSGKANTLARLATPVLFACVLAGCSGMADWTDPTGWFGGDSSASTNNADATQTADSGQTPDLASIPPKPAAPSTPDEQKQVSDSLAADRAQAQYSAETLEGGTEPVAAPPPAQPNTSAAAATAPQAQPADDTATASPTDTPAAADTSGTQVASTEAAAAPPAAPAVTAPSESSPPAATISATFAPSHAPALDPSVTQYVPPRILSRYQQTAAAASVPGVQGAPQTATARPAHRKTRQAAAPADTTPAPAPAQ